MGRMKQTVTSAHRPPHRPAHENPQASSFGNKNSHETDDNRRANRKKLFWVRTKRKQKRKGMNEVVCYLPYEYPSLY